MDVAIRKAVEADHAHILDSAWRSITKHPMTEDLSPGQVGRLISTLLLSWSCIVAVDPDTDTILGWLLYRDRETVGWIFTKPWYRGRGIARALLNHAEIRPAPALAFPTTFKAYPVRVRPFLITQELLG